MTDFKQKIKSTFSLVKLKSGKLQNPKTKMSAKIEFADFFNNMVSARTGRCSVFCGRGGYCCNVNRTLYPYCSRDMVASIHYHFPNVTHHVCVKQKDCQKELLTCRGSESRLSGYKDLFEDVKYQRDQCKAQLARLSGSFGTDQVSAEIPQLGSCKPHEQFFFLKTSKTGSTTIANIFARFRGGDK